MITRGHFGTLLVHDPTIDNPLQISTWQMGAAPRESAAPRPRADGWIDETAYLDAGVLSLAGYARGDTPRDAHEALDSLKAAIAISNGLVTHKFRREGYAFDEQVDVRISGPVDAQLRGSTSLIRWAATMIAPDPRIYSATESSASYDPTTSGGGGLVFPLVFPLVFDAAGSSGGFITAVNGGNVPTAPTFTIDGPVTNPTITNETTGLSIVTTGLAVASGETAVIDVAANTLTYNGITWPQLIDTTLTAWWLLEPGTNQIRMTGTGMVASTTELTVTWRDARI